MISGTGALPSGVIFDLDGTLIDSAPDVTAAVNKTLAGAGRLSVELREVRRMVGHGVGPLLRAAFMATGEPPNEQELAVATATYLEHYRRDPASQTLVFPGARDALQQLFASGVRLGICTNKPHELTLLVLEALDLASLFSAVAGGDTLPFKKPDRRHVDHVRRAMGCERKPTAFVGDSEIDMAAARAAGIPAVAVTFGYALGARQALDADCSIDHFSQLTSALAALGKAAKAQFR